MSSVKPTTFIILGGGGDLAQRKLLPSLFDLFIQKKLPDAFSIIGLARTTRTDSEYQILVHEAVKNSRKIFDQDFLDEFCTHISYVSGALDDITSYKLLDEAIHNFETLSGQNTNRIFYLAIPPTQYLHTFTRLHESGIANMPKEHSHWARILIEKPFGHNYSSALELDKKLSSLFLEEQIYRIDHYLAKEAVQNILSFRFANSLLLSPWNNTYIKEVHINMHEAIDVHTRGAFYDETGALRDVGQNHLLQILALIAMDQPESLHAEHIRMKRAEILEKLIPLQMESVKKDVVKAQYDGYTKTDGVAKDSKTETFFALKAFLDTPVWKDVPFFISAGKAMDAEKVSIEIEFHDVATGPFETSESKTVGNRIVLNISPSHSMHITLNVKQPGHEYQIASKTLSFSWDTAANISINAYEKVLLDCVHGDQTIFTQTEEVLASWKFITSITDNWESTPLRIYAKGSTEEDILSSNT